MSTRTEQRSLLRAVDFSGRFHPSNSRPLLILNAKPRFFFDLFNDLYGLADCVSGVVMVVLTNLAVLSNPHRQIAETVNLSWPIGGSASTRGITVRTPPGECDQPQVSSTCFRSPNSTQEVPHASTK